MFRTDFEAPPTPPGQPGTSHGGRPAPACPCQRSPPSSPTCGGHGHAPHTSHHRPSFQDMNESRCEFKNNFCKKNSLKPYIFRKMLNSESRGAELCLGRGTPSPPSSLSMPALLFFFLPPMKSDTSSKSSPRGGTGKARSRHRVGTRGAGASLPADSGPRSRQRRHTLPSGKNGYNCVSGTN